MANIQSQFNIVHSDSGLSVSSALVRSSNESAFTSNAVSVTTVDETVDLGDVVTAKHVFIKLVSGDPLKIGLDGATYPFRLVDTKEWMALRLDVEGLVETSTVIPIDDVAGALGGKYFDIHEVGNTNVRCWIDTGNGAGVAATGSITYGVPVNTDTVIVNGTTLTKVAAAPGANEFTSISELEALVEAIANINSTQNGTVVSISAAAVGTAGNAYTLALGGGNTGTMTISGSTLTGGVNPSVAPAVSGRLLPVVIAEGDSAATIATAIAAAFEADSSFTSAAVSTTATITDSNTGTRTTIADGTTGFSVARTQAGAASPVVHLKSTGTTSAVVVVAPN